MKSRSKELLDRAIAATVATIEIYNKPDFPYRSETFCILAINGWELLLKAKWLKENGMVGPYVWTAKRKKMPHPDGCGKWPSVSSPYLGNGSIPPLVRRAAPSCTLARSSVLGPTSALVRSAERNARERQLWKV